MLRASSCLMLEVNEFRCYEAKIEVGGYPTVGCGSVAEHWRLKTEVSWAWLPATPGIFTSLNFPHIKSKFIVRQDTLSTKHLYTVQQMEQYKANSIVLLSWHVNCKTHELSLSYVSFPALVATSILMLQYSKLQMAKAADKTPYVQVYNTCIYPSWASYG